MPPLGVLFLGAALEKNGCDVEIVPADVLGYNWKDVSKRITEFNPDVVGITTTSENRFDSFKLAQIVKRVNPEIVTVLGGPHISMAGKETLIHIKDVDVVVIGEGEETIVELARAIKKRMRFSDIRGIYYRKKDGEIGFTGIRDKIKDIDTLPFPARHLVPMDKYNLTIETRDGKRRRVQNIITSRGCPFNCYYCATPINWGRRVRGHSPTRVLEEIEHLIQTYGAEFIWFYDDTLNYDKARLERIMDLIIEKRLDIKFANEFRIDIVDRHLLEKMKAAGLERGYFGVEAGSSRVRRNIVKKDFDIEKVYRFVEWSKELDFVAGPFFIFSHHTETWDEAKETIKIMEDLKSINPQIDISTSILHIYPGTPLETIAKKEGILPEDFSWSKKKELKQVHALPAAQGLVPLFKDRLNWWQIADLVMRWSSASKKKINFSKIKQAVTSLLSVKNIFINFIFFITLLKYKVKKLF